MAESYMRVERHAAEGYALVVLAREPVNTMNLAFWQQLAATLTELEGDPAIRGAIFCRCLWQEGGPAPARLTAQGVAGERNPRCLSLAAEPGKTGGGKLPPPHPLVPPLQRPEARRLYGRQRHSGAVCAAHQPGAVQVGNGRRRGTGGEW